MKLPDLSKEMADVTRRWLRRRKNRISGIPKQLADVEAKLKAEQDQTLTPEKVAELQAKLAAAQAEWNSERMAEMQAKLGELQARLGELQGEAGARQGEFGEKMGKLGAEQGKLGAQQGKLGEEQGRLAQRSRPAGAQHHRGVSAQWQSDAVAEREIARGGPGSNAASRSWDEV